MLLERNAGAAVLSINRRIKNFNRTVPRVWANEILFSRFMCFVCYFFPLSLFWRVDLMHSLVCNTEERQSVETLRVTSFSALLFILFCFITNSCCYLRISYRQQVEITCRRCGNWRLVSNKCSFLSRDGAFEVHISYKQPAWHIQTICPVIMVLFFLNPADLCVLTSLCSFMRNLKGMYRPHNLEEVVGSQCDPVLWLEIICFLITVKHWVHARSASA